MKLMNIESEPTTAIANSGAGSTWPGKWIFLTLAAYFALFALLRGVSSETAGIDDVDQVLRAQIWSWGYGPQPPLYTWLTKIFLDLFGSNIFSLALLKELQVFAIYVFVYLIAERVTHSGYCALAATALLQFDPSIAWEAHRELTNSVLASAFVLATIYLFLRLDSNRWRAYAAFGICCGLGLLSKWNFAIMLAALLFAALGVAPFRSLVLNRKMVAVLLVTLALVALPARWILQHPSLAFSSVWKLRIHDNAGWQMAVAGLEKWAVEWTAHVALLLLALFIFFGRKMLRPAAPLPESRLLWLTLGWTMILITVAVIAFRAEGIRDRYLQPLFVWLPVLAATVLREHLTGKRLAAILAVSTAVAGGILAAVPGRLFLTEPLHRNEVLNTPFRKFATDLAPVVRGADAIIAENHPLAGNLRLWFPHQLVVDEEVAPLFEPPRGRVVLVWDATARPAPPARLLHFAHTFTGKSQLGHISRFEERLKYCRYRTMCLAAAPWE